MQGEILRGWCDRVWFLFFQSLWRELACAGIVKIPSKSAASPLECLTDNSGDVSRSIYSNLCLDRKNGYQHTCPHLDADSSGPAERPPAPPGAMTDAPSPPLPFLIAFSFIPRGVWHIELLHISSELSCSLALKIKQYFCFLIFFFCFPPEEAKTGRNLSIRDRSFPYFFGWPTTTLFFSCASLLFPNRPHTHGFEGVNEEDL